MLEIKQIKQALRGLYEGKHYPYVTTTSWPTLASSSWWSAAGIGESQWKWPGWCSGCAGILCEQGPFDRKRTQVGPCQWFFPCCSGMVEGHPWSTIGRLGFSRGGRISKPNSHQWWSLLTRRWGPNECNAACSRILLSCCTPGDQLAYGEPTSLTSSPVQGQLSGSFECCWDEDQFVQPYLQLWTSCPQPGRSWLSECSPHSTQSLSLIPLGGPPLVFCNWKKPCARRESWFCSCTDDQMPVGATVLCPSDSIPTIYRRELWSFVAAGDLFVLAFSLCQISSDSFQVCSDCCRTVQRPSLIACHAQKTHWLHVWHVGSTAKHDRQRPFHQQWMGPHTSAFWEYLSAFYCVFVELSVNNPHITKICS